MQKLPREKKASSDAGKDEHGPKLTPCENDATINKADAKDNDIRIIHVGDIQDDPSIAEKRDKQNDVSITTEDDPSVTGKKEKQNDASITTEED